MWYNIVNRYSVKVAQETLNLLDFVQFEVPVSIMSKKKTKDALKMLSDLIGNDPERRLDIKREIVLNRIEAWHKGDSKTPLIEFLNWTLDEYKNYVEHDELPEQELNKYPSI